MQEKLQGLPKGLDETYDRILMNIDEEYHEDTKMFLKWLAFSVRPLKLEEIAEVATINFHSENGPIYDSKCRYKDQESVLTVCSSLVTHSAGSA